MPTSEVWYEDDDVKVVIEWNEGQPFIHLTLYRWSASVFKKLAILRHKFKQHLRSLGYKVAFAYNRHEDAHWYKFMDVMCMRKLGMHNGLTMYFLETKDGT